MFGKIRIKFIALSMSALFILLFSIVLCMNIVNYKSIIEEADSTLAILAENKGAFPPFPGGKLPPFMSQETPYETRYFSVLMNDLGGVVNADISRIAVVDFEKAYEYTTEVMASEDTRGFVGEYRYIKQSENGLQRVTFLDMGRKMYSFRTFLQNSIMIALGGYTLFFIVIAFFSKKIIRPVAESYEKQKRFITDAGHEIKTPIAIINADAEVLGMDIGENEWIEDIQNQVKRLTTLTNDLVYLSQMEEEEKNTQMIEFPFSDVVQEMADSFYALAKTQNKGIQCKVMPMLSFCGNEKSIRQLINILMDNAIKYSPENGTISVEVAKQGKNLMLSIYNTTQVQIPKEKLDLIFERFYRIDPSRSTMTGGYGIGLSVAKAIVNAHNGKIYATTEDEHSLKIVVLLPM